MTTFDEIRPYNDDEVKKIALELVNDPMFAAIIGKLYPKKEMKEQVLQSLSNINSIEELQTQIIVPILVQIEKASTKGISYRAMEQFHPNESYLFISNHRDIILDSAFLNVIMHKQGFPKTEIAIGDNLLAYPWIEKLVRVNRSFLVKRNLGLREQLLASKKLSSYIRFAIKEKNQSVWIAQREGRTKDGDDQTQPAVLKMLNMSNSKSITEGFKEINIVPMAISYEIEPCAISKVEELLNRKHNPNFKKSQEDDLKSMTNGVLLPKGRINFAFGNPVNLKIEELTNNKSKNEAIQEVANYINRRIHYNYKLWPNNYIAADLLDQSKKHETNYTYEEKELFVDRMEKELSTLSYSFDESAQQYLKMYANPVLNFEKHFA